MKKQLRLGIFLVVVFFVGIFSLKSLFLYNAEEVTTEVKDSTIDLYPDTSQNTSESDKKTEDTTKKSTDKSTKKEDTEKKETVEVNTKDNTKNEQAEDIVDKKEDKDIVDSQENQKIAYLTFDDGPSLNVTPAILDILKENNIKATFFVVGAQAEKYPELLLRIAEEGHLIGNHSYSHDYKYLYSNTNNFLSDINQTKNILHGILGDKFDPTLIRFPGGSFGKNKGNARNTAIEHGFRYVDWNVLNGDAEGVKIPAAKLLARTKETLRNQKSAVVLMHDHSAKETTAEALPEIIEYIKSQGYIFKTLEDYGVNH